MANLFDGENLIITLEPVVGGVLTVDVLEDLYEDGKDWYRAHPDNRRYPFPFVSDGGNPLTAVIDQGAYIFLDNVSGWRLKPAENDGSYFFIGNLAVLDTNTPALVPTDGAFTAAIFGLQPITQGVVPQMRAQLAFNTFQGYCALDTGNRTGNAVSGVGEIGLDVIGTRRLPVNNLADAKLICDANGLNEIRLLSSLDSGLDSTDFSLGFNFVGDAPEIAFAAGANLNLTNCSFTTLELSGEMDGVNVIRDCHVGNITNFSGHIRGSDLDGIISLNGSIEAIDCYSGIAGLGYSTITNIGSNTVILRRMNGSIGVADMTGGDHSIGVYGGRIVVEASCSGGSLKARGDPYEITDLSGGAVTIVDQIGGENLRELHGILGLSKDTPVTINEDGSISFGGLTISANTTGITPSRATTLTRT